MARKKLYHSVLPSIKNRDENHTSLKYKDTVCTSTMMRMDCSMYHHVASMYSTYPSNDKQG